MPALQSVKNTVGDVIEATSGVGGIATAPFTDSKTVLGQTKKVVKQATGTLFDGVLIIPSTAALYMLLVSPSEQESSAFRWGSAVGAGIGVFAASILIRRILPRMLGGVF